MHHLNIILPFEKSSTHIKASSSRFIMEIPESLTVAAPESVPEPVPESVPESNPQAYQIRKRPQLPKITQFFQYHNRLASFSDWPIEWEIDGAKPAPELLARAGFFSHHVPGHERDNVVCPHCKIFLDHWEPTDDPAKEHKKRAPQCEFVRRSLRARRQSAASKSTSLNNMQDASALAESIIQDEPVVSTNSANVGSPDVRHNPVTLAQTALAFMNTNLGTTAQAGEGTRGRGRGRGRGRPRGSRRGVARRP